MKERKKERMLREEVKYLHLLHRSLLKEILSFSTLYLLCEGQHYENNCIQWYMFDLRVVLIAEI